jgi:hypothetical protein
MGKLNTDVSIVDYLNSKGKDSSFAARKKLADQYGITGYENSANNGAMNTKLLQALKSGATPTVGKVASNTAVDNQPVVKAIPQNVPKAVAQAPVTPTAPTYQRVQPVAPTYDYGVEAPKYTGSYDQQIASLYQNILNTGSFNYDMNNDQLYNQYKDAYTKQANLSMRDTMGNASALTGGYGSSYAGNVGQQAYNAQMDNLNNIVPQLSDRAYQQYQDGLNAQYNQLSAAQKMSDNEYGKYLDSYNQWAGERDDTYQQYLNSINQYNYENETVYNQGRDSLSDERYQDETLYSRGRDTVADTRYTDEVTYGKERDSVADQQWQDVQDYNKSQDAIDNNYKQQSLNNAGRKSAAEEKEEKGYYDVGTKGYVDAKSDLSSQVMNFMDARDEFGEPKYSSVWIANWIVHSSENEDMADELLQAYGLDKAYYEANQEKPEESSGSGFFGKAIDELNRIAKASGAKK